MHFGKLIVVLLLLPQWIFAQVTFPVADSLSWKFYAEGNWQAVDSIGRVALKNNIDYPYLRMRMGYAAYCRNNFSRSAQQYQKALAMDQGNSTARWFLYENNLLLGRNETADWYASGLADSVKEKINWKNTEWINRVDGELAIKFPQTTTRSSAIFPRIGINSRFGKRWNLYQSVSFYRQDFYSQVPDTAFRPPPGFPPPQRPPLRTVTDSIRQWGYYARLSALLSPSFFAWVSGNFLSGAQYLVGAGMKKQFPYFDVSAEGDYGVLSSVTTWQLSASAMYFPLGNSSLYFFGRGAMLHSGKDFTVVTGGMGVKIGKMSWLEFTGTTGQNKNYSEAQGLYVYNMADFNRVRFICSLYLPLSDHVQLRLQYAYDKQEFPNNNQFYSQNSITGGLLWKK